MIDNPTKNDFYKARLTESEFNRLSQFIYSGYGIKMPISKKIMLESRLQKRLKATGLPTFKEYLEFVFDGAGGDTEVIHLIDVVSTNKTDFFREPMHFDFMRDHILPETKSDSLKIWSAAASSGEELYTISIIINEFNKKNPLQKKSFSILGTDISTDILKKGIAGVYKMDRVANIPLSLKKKYFLKSKDTAHPLVRVIPELRRNVSFRRLNLMDSNYAVNEQFDIIFCRNVLIYFDRETQEKVINKLCSKLKPGGYFFLGHSESITGIDVPLKSVKPTIYIRN